MSHMDRIGARRDSEGEDDSIGLACRRMWSSVVLAALNDYWSRMGKDGYDRDATHREALIYFSSKDGRRVTGWAGIDATPEKMAAAAVSQEAKDLTIRARGQGPEAMRRHRAKKKAEAAV